MMKKNILFLVVVLLVMTVSPALGSEVTPYSIPHDGQVDYTWRVASKNATGTTTRGSSKVLFYEGAPAGKNGETDTCGTSVTYSVETSGTFQVSKNSVAASLGLSIGKSYTFEASKTSAPLDKGEYVKAYYTKNWQQYTINQEYIKHTTWYSFDENGNPTGIHSSDEVVKTATGYIFKPLMPKITLQYFMSNTKGMRTGGTSQPTRTEVYEWSGGEYVLTKVYSY